MVDRILTILDSNNEKEKYAVIAQLVDWAQAFDRQCPKIGVKSFIKNGVRKSIIPLLMSYFQNRKMRVKWHNKLSTVRDLPGGGPQGSTFGLIEYDSQSNDNTVFLPEEDKFKFNIAHSDVTLLTQCCNTTHTVLYHCSHSAVTLLTQCCNTAHTVL